METSYCIFKINQHLSAVNTDYLGEVFALPELILVPNAPSGIVGVIDLRGDVLPVVDFRLRTEGVSLPYLLTDSIILLKQADLSIGIIVNTVQDIRELSIQGMMAEVSDPQDWMNPDIKSFFAGMILSEEDIFILSEPRTWFNPGELQQVIAITRFLVDDFNEARSGQSEKVLSEETITVSFCPDATPQEKSIFRQRADNLKRPPNADQFDITSKTFIVIVLGDQLLGLDASFVREFITISKATPIPCCPRHIIGNTNLRGEALTVIDISEPLGIIPKPLVRQPKAVVVEFKKTVAALVIEDIRDALFEVNPNEIKTGSMVPTQSTYVQGATPYGEQIMHILDLPKLLYSDELVVNEVL